MLLHELVPVGLGGVTGLAIWHRRLGDWRLCLAVTTVMACALAANALSGEAVKSWVYLPLDVMETAVAFCAAAALRVRLAAWRRGKPSRVIAAP